MLSDDLQRELRVDPRTGLALVDIPAEYKQSFRDLDGGVLHWFGEVSKVNRRYEKQLRVLFITNQCLYMCTHSGEVTRCVQVKDIPEVVVDTELPDYVALVVKPVDDDGQEIADYDMLFVVKDQDEYHTITSLLDRIRMAATGQPIPRRFLKGSRLDEPNVMNLMKPPGWRLLWVPVLSKEALFKDETAPHGYSNQRELEEDVENREMVYQAFDRVKASLKDEVANMDSDRYEQMARDVELSMEMLDDRDRELSRLRHQLRMIHDDPDVWRHCPNCRTRELGSGGDDVDAKELHMLERRLEDYEHLIDHRPPPAGRRQPRRCSCRGATQQGSSLGRTTTCCRSRRS